MDMESLIDMFESEAIKIGDLKRAIKYNWLRNSVKSKQTDPVEALDKLIQIRFE